MLFEHATTPTKQGDIGEARAIYEYTRMGYTVARTLFDSAKYDLILDTGTELKRVQVKTSKCKAKEYGKWAENSQRTGYKVQLTTTGSNRTKTTRRAREENDYDILFVLTEDGRCWSIPTSELTATTTTNVGASGSGAKYAEFEIK